MIVDCYTYTWESADQLGRCLPPQGDAGLDGRSTLGPQGTDASTHLAAADPVGVTIVLGFKSAYLEADIPNDQVSEYVAAHKNKLIGFAGVDPSEPKEAIAELARAQDELNMPGAAVAPAAQNFHPSNSQAMLVYAEAARRGMPIIFHTGVFICSQTKLEYAQPVLLDEIAREFPDLKIIIAHMGYPWMHETTVLLGKHKNVYAETSWLLHQPWQAYQALLEANQYGVMDKLLFGSGFPGSAASVCIEALYSIGHLYHGTNLPSIPREQLRQIVERDTLGLLGITSPFAQPEMHPATTDNE